MPITDDAALCDALLAAPRAADRASLRLDADDAEARAQARDLLANGRLGRRVFEVMSDAVERDDTLRALDARAILTAADEETMGWQADALRLLERPRRGARAAASCPTASSPGVDQSLRAL